VYGFTDVEQALREWTTAQRAMFSLRQRVEKQRWESEILAPAQAKILAAIHEGQAPTLELPEGLVE
jgi:hypothetical protein